MNRKKRLIVKQLLDLGNVVLALSLFVLGGICLVHTERILHAFPYLFGGFVFVAGLAAMIGGICEKEYVNMDSAMMSKGIIALILGGIILTHHEDAIVLISAIWGIKGLASSVHNLNVVLYHLHRKEKITVELIELLVEFPLSVLLLLDPVGNLPHHIQFLGLEQMGTGIQLMIERIISRRKIRKLSRQITVREFT